MIIQIKTFQITCDSCKKEAVYHANKEYDRPKGWTTKTAYCGDSYCSGHSNDICPKCRAGDV